MGALHLLWQDIVTIIMSTTVENLVWMGLGAMWLVIVCFPLSGVDKRDPSTAMTFVLFATVAGITLFKGVMKKFATGEQSMVGSVGLFFTLGLIAAARWVLPMLIDFNKDDELEETESG